MTRDEIADLLGKMITPSVREGIEDHPAFSKFCDRLQPIQYNQDRLVAAWTWYRDGWYDHRETLEATAASPSVVVSICACGHWRNDHWRLHKRCAWCDCKNFRGERSSTR